MILRKKSTKRRKKHQSPLRRFENLEPRIVLDARLLITEFVASNDNSLSDEDGDDPDWIELFNAGQESVNLEGWHLTDDPLDLGKSELGARDILPGEYLVVFASGKDRDDPLVGNLHTNFKLSSSGEYLGLTRPDESIAFEYAPSYPIQVEDVGYGIPSEVTQTVLLAAGAGAKLLVPTNGDLDPDLDSELVEGSWIDPAFDDNQWTNAFVGVGYADEPKPGEGTLIADSVAEFSDTQGSDNWRFGYWTKSQDRDGVYDANSSDFNPFIKVSLAFLNSWNADEMMWDLTLPTLSPQTTQLRSDSALPSGSNSGKVQHPIRRWESEVDGGILIHGTIDNPDPSGDGVVARILIDGQEVYSQQFNGNSAEYSLLRPIEAGQLIDFVLDAGDADNDIGDDTNWTVKVEDVTAIVGDLNVVQTLTDDITSDIGNAMQGIGSSAYVRVPFTPETADFDSLALKVKYQDGFVAYLNGQEVARSDSAGDANATWQSVADSERTVEEAKQFEAFNITSALDLLSPGVPNVLTLHALNVSADDDDLLLVPELVGTNLEVDEAGIRYFQRATPGEQNGIGTDEFGPLFSDQEFVPLIGGVDEAEPGTLAQSGDALVVTARISETFHPVDGVELHYHVMFGDESTVIMVDDGSGRDSLAGDGIYTAVIPGGLTEAGEMVRWYMTASDTDGNDSRFPLFDSPTDSEEYFGTVAYDPSVESSNLPIMHWFVEAPSRANSTSGTRGSFFYDGEFYDNVQFDIHGQSTRAGGFLKKSYDVDFTKDHRFRWKDGMGRMKDINLLTNFADKGKFRNELSYEAWGLAGGATHLAEPVRVQQNGEFFAIYDFVEDGDDRYLERLGLDPNGALYKMYNNGNSGASGNEKKTRKDEDISDLQEILDAGSLTGSALKEYMFDNIDIPSTINFLAAQVVNSNVDCCHKNYYMYRDTEGTGKWTFLPWDADLSFGRTWTPTFTYFDDVIRIETSVPHSRMVVTSALYNIPEFREMYMRRVRTLIDDFLQPNDTPVSERYLERRLDEILAKLDPTDDDPATGTDDYDLDFQKWGTWGNDFTMRDEIASVKSVFLPQRREFIYDRRTAGNGGEIAPADTGVYDLSFGAFDANPNSGNQDQEFIEIVNNGSAAVDLTGWQIGGGIRHDIEPGTVIAAGGSLYLTPDLMAFRSRASGPSAGQGLFIQEGYNGHLSNFGESIELRGKDGSVVAEFTVPGVPSDVQNFLRVSEIMYNPSAPTAAELAIDGTLENDDFEFIELMNTSTNVTLDLNGTVISQGFSTPFEFAGSAVTSLAPGERVLVASNTAAFETRYGAGLNVAGAYDGGLSNGGEDLKVDDADGSTVVEFSYDDSSLWPQAADGVGASLEYLDLGPQSVTETYDKYYNWKSSESFGGTPGAPANSAPVVVINEVVANTDSIQLDAVELRNTSSSTVEIGGWYLSDSSTNLLKFEIPMGTTLAAGEFIVFDESHFNPTPLTPAAEHFALNGSEGDDVWLVVSDGNVGVSRFVDDVHFRETATGQAIGLSGNSNGRLTSLTRPTLGCHNSQPLVDDVHISAINYLPGAPTSEALSIYPDLDSNDLEYLVIETGGTEADLSGWRIRGGIDFEFDSGSSFADVFVLSFDPSNPDNADRTAAFRSHHGLDASAALIGGYSGSLDNLGEQIRLERPDAPPLDDPALTPFVTVDEVIYDDQHPWPLSTAGDPLVRRSSMFYGNNANSWTLESANTGSVAGDFNGDGETDVFDLELLSAAVNRGSQNGGYVLSGDRNSPDGSDVQTYVTNVLGTFMGDANLDGAVNATDLNQVGLHWQETACGGWSDGDFNSDGIVNATDLNFVGVNWQQSAVLPAANVARTPQAALAQRQRNGAGPKNGEDSAIDRAVAELSAECHDDTSMRSTSRHQQSCARRSRSADARSINARDSAIVSFATDLIDNLR